MQLRALIKTRRRKWAMIVLGVVVCAAAVWLLLDVGHKPTDEEKYQGMVRSQNWGMRWYNLRTRHKFPTPLDNALRNLQTRSFENSYDQQKELLASGYLVTLTVTNVRDDPFKILDQIGSRCYWRYYEESNALIITCRSNDTARIRAVSEKQP